MKKTRYYLTRLVFCTLFISITFNVFCQQVSFESPLNIPLLLSGNFGELRSNHFHAGIDIKTLGQVGQPVLAVEEGYISRIKIQSGGYGNALYLTHPNGYTSVYGHLNKFEPALQDFIVHKQYGKKSFEVDIYLESDQFYFNKGQLIAYSGNSGRSGGPHLHFEIRTTKEQIPQNGLKFSFPIEDTIPPAIKRLAVYQFSNTETYETSKKVFYPVYTSNNNTYYLKDSVRHSGTTGFGLEVYDFLNGSNNKCGVYQLQFFIDQQLYHSFIVDNISFATSRYINSHMDYYEKKLNSRNIHKLYRDPGNLLNIYGDHKGNGLFADSFSQAHHARIVARDVYGNESILEFTFHTDGNSNPVNQENPNDPFFNYMIENTYENGNFILKIPEGALYHSSYMQYSKSHSDSLYRSDIHVVQDEFHPLHKSATIKIKPYNKFYDLRKYYIASINYKGELESEGGYWEDGFVCSTIRSLGKFVVAVDTIPPEIKVDGFKNGAWYQSGNTISFSIEDKLSGIEAYNGYVDDVWVLFKFDAKSGKLSYSIDEKVKKTGKHDLKIYVRDDRKNLAVYQGEFYY